MRLTSPPFQQGEIFPDQYTCRGENFSPPLSWTGKPEGTRSFALIVEDPDAPKGKFTHWVAWNIPAEQNNLPSGITSGNGSDGLLDQGVNSFGESGFGGPCPPEGHGVHRYFFKLFALDTDLNLRSDSGQPDLENAMKNHVLDRAELIGKYEIK